jgi:cytochrome P450
MQTSMQLKPAAIVAPDVASPQFKADPYPFYARLRAEAPAFRLTLPGGRPAWLVTRYDDEAALLRDERFVKNQRAVPSDAGRPQPPWVPNILRPLANNMLDLDPPDHTRLRALVHQAFTPRRVEQLHGRIETLAGDLLAAAHGQGGGAFDLLADFALPLPVTVIGDLLGIPPGDRHRFHRWSARIVSITSPRDALWAIPHALAFMRYLRRLFRRRRAEPTDDLLTALLQAEAAGDRLSEDELLAMVFLLLVAGHETTVNLIASGTLALLEHPQELARLRDNPRLIRPAVEELLRFTSPVEIATERYAREPVTIAGETLRPGDLALAVLGAANRDAAQFPSPDTLDLGREPNRHLAFGQGWHYCLGAPLARLEGQIAFETILRRLPDLRLACPRESLRWRRGLFLRGLRALPLAGSGATRRRWLRLPLPRRPGAAGAAGSG